MRAHIETQIREHFPSDFEAMEGYAVEVAAVVEEDAGKQTISHI